MGMLNKFHVPCTPVGKLGVFVELQLGHKPELEINPWSTTSECTVEEENNGNRR